MVQLLSASRTKKEVLALVLAVIAVDAAFIGAYYLANFRQSSNGLKLAFTAVWTLVTLGVVIRGLSRIRSARLERK